ncbi:hypothetical protein LSH36_432g00021 [Paralvinella palmiformis]|uniref:Rab-GAP TBC domain-containing protein n=1 Tax=Paralvinella palmiformis TaxID=53620 RepID=A0AAD9JB90_9ANNE|nr:hypothetical protein LSH36_432g00021 [Paralvinella palmiformis]
MNNIDFEEVSYPPRPKTTLSLDGTLLCERPGKHLAAEELETFIDKDGRLVDEHRLRKAVFRGGVEPNIRRRVWQYLFHLYPFNSTQREREALLADYKAKYQQLKNKWKELIQDKIDIDGEKLVSPSYLHGIKDSFHTEHQDISPGIQQQNMFLDMQAQVYAGRQQINWDELLQSMRIVDKDVPRTDRNLEFFKGSNPNLLRLRDILITFAAYHEQVGYVQGMNDLVSMFLQVFNNEVEAYWCFEHYMAIDHVMEDFLEGGMMTKLSHVQQLLRELDPDLMKYFEYLGAGDLTMCHRWMLLSFKREFPDEDTLKCFEILRSQHLEVYSIEAELARDDQRRKDFMKLDGTTRVADAIANPDFTFDVFMCVTILIQYRDDVFFCSEMCEVFQLIIGLTKKLNLDVVLQKTEVLFYKYCKKAASECFDLIEMPTTSAVRTELT